MTTHTRPWAVAPADASAIAAVTAAGYSPVVARILASRGLTSAEDARAFLTPDLARDWDDPLVIPGMAEAAEAVAAAVTAGSRIVVFGDFDLDGISAAALAARGLRAMGADATPVVPHRFREGYGLSAAAIERVMLLSPELIVTVDCGISSREEVSALVAAGVAVVVTDHHEPGGDVPEGVPVANPKLRPDGDDAPSAQLAGAGVALKLVQAVGALVGHADAWRDLTDLATLGTVADIVPMRSENRALVADGVSRMRSGARPCLAALAGVASVDLPGLTSDQIAFAFAPRLNAPGRVADPATALALLMEDDPAAATALATELDEQNKVRQAVEQDLRGEAEEQAAAMFAEGDRALVLAGEGWHEGVKGIVASRLASAYGVPTILFCVEDGVAKGSGRTAGAVDLYAAVASASDLITRFGGHTAAVGLTLPAEALPRFRERLAGTLAALPQEAFDSAVEVDAEVGLGEIGAELAAEIALLEPFGFGNRKPVLGVGDVFLNGRQRVGRTADHLRFSAYDGTVTVPAVAFRCRDIERVSQWDGAADLTFQIDVDRWRGRDRVQMIVRGVHPHEPPADGPAAELVEDLFARADEIVAGGEYAGIGDAEAFHTKLAGVTFEGRQDVLAALAPGLPLRLTRQPDNEYDANAVAVFDPAGDQVGYLNRRLAAVLAPVLDAGVEYDVEVTEVTGGAEDRSLGVNVLVSRRGSREDAAEDAAERAARKAVLAAMAPAELDAALVSLLIGDADLHDAQRASLDALAAGRDTLTVMATGRGKSLIFHLHAARLALRENLATVLVFPLRALVADQAFHLVETFAEIGLTVRTVTGESAAGARDDAFSGLAEGTVDVVLTTPEFLHHHAQRFAETGRIGFVVVDEAHHVGMARAGHRPAYARLGEALDALGRPRVLAVTATAGDEVAPAIVSSLGIDEVVTDATVRDNLCLEDRRGGLSNAAAKDAYLATLAARGGKLIVYVNSREQSVRTASALRAKVPALTHRVAFYNGGLSRSARHAVERAFRAGDISVVVATSAFGEGVNIPDVRDVALYHLPFNDVEFNQMCGRCGRDGAAATVHLLFGEQDGRVNELVLESSAPERDDLAALYLSLKDAQAGADGMFEITNAELAEKVKARRPKTRLSERGVSAGLGVFRELGLVTGEGHGPYRRLCVPQAEGKVDLDSSVRYAEGKDEIEQFVAFREWVLTSAAPDLLARFNRPILPSRSGASETTLA